MVVAVATRFRTDVIGSLMRPPQVLAAQAAFRAETLDEAELRRAEDLAILEALQRQRELGLDVVTDGEMRRDAWMTEFSDAVDGFAAEYPVVQETRPDGSVVSVERHTKVVVAALRQRRRLTAYEVPFLQQHTGQQRYKITLPSPNVFGWGSFQAGVTDAAYATREALHADAVDIVRREVQALIADGVPYLQLDEGFNRHVSPAWRDARIREGLDPAQLLAQDIALENQCYDALAEQLFNELHVDRFLLEYDTDRAGGFEPLRFLPRDKTVVLGLVSTKRSDLEPREDLLRRIDEASKFVSIEQLALSPQCGFYHGVDDDTMTIDEQWRKLRLVVDTAREIWGG